MTATSKLIWIAAAIIGISLPILNYLDPPKPVGSSRSVAPPTVPERRLEAGDRVTLTRDTIGCVWEVQEKVRDYAIAKDEEAVKRVWIAGMLAGRCWGFQAGDQVIVLERSLWQNMTRIKRVGAVGDYWIAGVPQ